MKKLLSLLLAVVLVFTIVNVMAVAAEKETPNITIDGVKDEAYQSFRVLGSDCWQPWADNSNITEPVDIDRVKPTLWFDWDDNFVYIYFQVESKDALYKAVEGEPKPDRGITWYEQLNVYLDTSPSIPYEAPCTQGGVNDDGTQAICDHFCCNANQGEGRYYRLMCRYSAAWDEWHNYYRADEGVFMTYEEFLAWRCDPASRGYDASYVDDPMGWYMKENGAGDIAGFVDYETNTYGFELKYPRNPDEEYFKFNVGVDVNAKEWDEYGPELGYTMAICQPAWLNQRDMLQIWYDDYISNVEPPEVNAFRRMKEQLPLEVASIGREHRIQVIELNAAFEKLTDEQKGYLTAEEVEFVTKAFEKIGKLDYLAALGDANGDGAVNATDALVALRASVGKTELDAGAVARAEVNGDGKVDAKDALEMLQYTVGKRKEFTIAKSIDL